MTPVGGWLLVPAAFALLCTGIGLLGEAAARRRVPGPFVPAVGLAGMIVIAGLLTLGATARFAPAACAVAAVAGFASARRRGRVPGWSLTAAAAGFVLAAAPSVMSGQASVLGYDKYDDSVLWLGLIEHFMAHGRPIDGVPGSTYQATLLFWLDQGYPIGSMTPVGVVARLTGQAYVNAYQPVISGYVGILALGLYGCARELVARPALAALAGVVGSQASLLMGYAAWGAIKETCVAALLPALAAVRVLPLLALLGGATLCAYGVGGLVFAGPALLLGLLAAVVQRGWRPCPFLAGVAVLVVAAFPAAWILQANAMQMVNGSPSAADDLGKLYAPLEVWQGAGLWPEGDFRFPIDHHGHAVILALFGLAAAVLGVGLGVRRRRWGLPVLIVTAVGGGAVVVVRAAPWIDAKIYAIVAPQLLAAGAAFLLADRRRAPLAGILVVGAAWSTALVFRDVQVAPRDMLREERALGQALAGRGPTLVLNYEGYGTRYLFAPAEADGISELRHLPVFRVDGQEFPQYATAEMDDVRLDSVLQYRAIVRRRTPTGSLPPSVFRRFRAGNLFESWTRDPTLPVPLVHLPLSTDGLPASDVECRQLRALAETDGATTLAAAPRENPVLATLTDVPAGWTTTDGVRPRGSGTARTTVTVPTAGPWRLWVSGSVRGRLTVRVDGRVVGSYRHQLDAAHGWLRFGVRSLAPGPHAISVSYDRGPFWWAGRGPEDGRPADFPFPATEQPAIGPVALSPERTAPVVRVPVGDVDRLCDGRTYDWIEAL